MTEAAEVTRAATPDIVAAVSRRAQRIEGLLRGLAATNDPERRATLLFEVEREAHSLRGAAAMLGLEEAEALAAGLELLSGRAEQAERPELLRLAVALSAIDPSPGEVLRVESAGDGSGPLVLCVDDDEANLSLLGRVLDRRTHLRFVPARTGAEALALARAETPSLVLLDLHLPDVSGADVLADFRADPVLAGVQVFILTADTAGVEKDTLLAAGADGYLAKPLDIARLLGLLDSVRRAL